MKHVVTKTKTILALSLIAAALSTSAMAEKPHAGEGAAIVSEPGKAAIVQAVKISAKVIAIEKETRTITLKGPKGKVVDIVAGDKVRNFDQIKLGDMVVVRYTEALTLELKKAASGSGDVTVVEEAERAKSGERPSVAGGRQVSALAEVVAVDPKASTITIRGPKGNEVTLDVLNPDQFKVVKKGDQIEVTYTEAIALSVEPASRSAKEKQK
jgi:hypothetical protein